MAGAMTPPMRRASEPSDQAPDVRLIIDSVPTLAWSARPDGSAEFFNRRWLDYTGLSAEEALDWGWKVTIHPDDLHRLQPWIRLSECLAASRLSRSGRSPQPPDCRRFLRLLRL